MSFLCAFAPSRLCAFAPLRRNPKAQQNFRQQVMRFIRPGWEAAGANAIRLIALRKAFALASTLSVEGQVAAVGTENIGTEP
jgi:hypothetical protein